ncbi:hypothetical protein BG011_004215 [Mortierella polycephala]|uniref:Uncharacterized protein n=1 Tax=Mortierella polycephala TaxID=41804 RepID=A0A9P6U1X9_9FUNG|nr:hypothetical protein BG011_004215 [Mortierella polycephala]
MSKHTRKPKTVPTFLQPNTVLSSRAAIFDDEYGLPRKSKVSKRSTLSIVSSKRNQERDKQESESEDEDEDEAKAILERLYGQLQGAIEINDSTDKAPDHAAMSSSTSDSEQSQAGQNEEEVDVMEFRLFASQDTPTTIVLAQTQPELVYVHRERPDLEESPGSERMNRIADATIDNATVMEQAKVPWTRAFFAHKVIHVPYKQQTCSGTTKKSKRKREWEKKVKAGLIDQATIDATARRVKVSESWSKPHLVRKGLDRDTIDTGAKQTTRESSARGGGRGGRGGAQRGRGASRGGRGGRGGARGGITSGTNEGRGGDHQHKVVNKSDGDVKPESSATTVPRKRKVDEHGVEEAPKKHKTSDLSATKQMSGHSSMSTSPGSKDKAMISSGRSSSNKIAAQDSTSSSTPSKEKKAALPPKKPKASKPQSKLDNIMAILTGK